MFPSNLLLIHNEAPIWCDSKVFCCYKLSDQPHYFLVEVAHDLFLYEYLSLTNFYENKLYNLVRNQEELNVCFYICKNLFQFQLNIPGDRVIEGEKHKRNREA